jgi:putative ABC transport system permease protein
MRELRQYLSLIFESMKMSIQALLANKLRSILSVLGITIGVFAIILVFSLVDSLEKNIRDSLEELGSDVIFVQKWPWDMSSGYPWWEYLNRPVPTYDEYEYISEKSSSDIVEMACFVYSSGNNLVEFGKYSATGVGVLGVSHEYSSIQDVPVARGRYFNPIDSDVGMNVALIGNDLAIDLFGQEDPLGKTIKIKKHRVKVIGLIEKQGESPIGNSLDDNVIIPVKFMRRMVRMNKQWGETFIMAKAAKNVPLDVMEYELSAMMRSKRKLRPSQNNSFALNRLTMITNQLSMIFTPLNLAGLFIGGFSIVVGCFGVANIMFVSVKERTHIIGIQKSLGAKKYFIQLQFLVEAIILSILGGAIGIAGVYLTVIVGNIVAETQEISMRMFLTTENFILGLTISFVVGILAGIIPAIMASNLDPVEAIRS